MDRTESPAGVHCGDNAETVGSRCDDAAGVALSHTGHRQDGDRAEREGAEEFGGEAFEVVHAGGCPDSSRIVSPGNAGSQVATTSSGSACAC